MALDIMNGMRNGPEGKLGWAVMDDEVIAIQWYPTRLDAEIGLMYWQNEEDINTAIEEALEELEGRLCHEFGVGDIEPARERIRAYTRHGY